MQLIDLQIAFNKPSHHLVYAFHDDSGTCLLDFLESIAEYDETAKAQLLLRLEELMDSGVVAVPEQGGEDEDGLLYLRSSNGAGIVAYRAIKCFDEGSFTSNKHRLLLKAKEDTVLEELPDEVKNRCLICVAPQIFRNEVGCASNLSEQRLSQRRNALPANLRKRFGKSKAQLSRLVSSRQLLIGQNFDWEPQDEMESAVPARSVWDSTRFPCSLSSLASSPKEALSADTYSSRRGDSEKNKRVPAISTSRANALLNAGWRA